MNYFKKEEEEDEKKKSQQIVSYNCNADLPDTGSRICAGGNNTDNIHSDQSNGQKWLDKRECRLVLLCKRQKNRQPVEED